MSLLQEYKPYLKNREFLLSSAVGILLLLFSFYINFRAGNYATAHESNSVTDIVLSNIRVYDVDVVFIEGSILFWVFVTFFCLHRPQRLPFTIKSIALFVLIRSVFVSLTHIGPFPTQMVVDSTSIIRKFTFGGDLFFSGHTGLPFLMCLVFWKDRFLRAAFFFCSVMFAFVVLMAHLHYTIDVLAAFFITYTIHHIAEVFWKKDRLLFYNGIR